MTYEFDNDKQREAARIILKRCSGDTPPNKLQLSKLVISKSAYNSTDSAKEFVKNFVEDPSTPVESEGNEVTRRDLKEEVAI